MPEYLAPGVYVEETSFRSKSIEGVSTSTAGFVGPTRYGPVSGEPELITSLADFTRIYGDLEDLSYGENGTPRTNYVAHAVRAFFTEGGKRLYVQRVFNFPDDFSPDEDGVPNSMYATGTAEGTPTLTLVARFPGVAGNMRITFTLQKGNNVLTTDADDNVVLTRVQMADVVYFKDDGNSGLYEVGENGDGDLQLEDGNGGTVPLPSPLNGEQVFPVSVLVQVEWPTQTRASFKSPEALGTFSFNTKREDALTNVFLRQPSNRRAALTMPFAIETIDSPSTLEIANSLFPNLSIDDEGQLQEAERIVPLEKGSDGELPKATHYKGEPTSFDDYANHGNDLALQKNGLLAFEGIEGISIVAAPGYSDGEDDFAIQNEVINHCETMRYRIAVLDSPPKKTVTGVLEFRNRRSSDYAALYYPWVVVSDPTPGREGERLKLPPSGFVSGIYARNDVEHAVFKAPANEVVRLAIDFEQILSKAQQEVLNPEGVNCFRFFEGRGYLLWGARTISDDPEWKYVSLRRYFAYLERSIDEGTQWAVFRNNNRELWANVRQTIEDFLFNEWRAGGLMGAKPEEAYFVRCDRTTMTQNDLDNGRLICLIGVAPVRPAEFVIFRIGQWTAGSNR